MKYHMREHQLSNKKGVSDEAKGDSISVIKLINENSLSHVFYHTDIDPPSAYISSYSAPVLTDIFFTL